MEAMQAESESLAPAVPPHRLPFEFHGNAREYFGIWIVNLLLTVVTLGIYSAWAKVRTNRYFYGNTLLAGSAFDYTADPKKILAGRALAVVLLVIYQVSFQFFPESALYVLALLMLAVPLIYVASLSFRMRYSLWRGINFSFQRHIGRAYLLFSPLLLYLLLVTLGPLFFGLSEDDIAPPEEGAELSPALANYLIFNTAVVLGGLGLFPWWQRYYYQFVGNRVRYGKARFGVQLSTGTFYGFYLLAFGLAIAGGIVLGVVMGVSEAIGLLDEVSLLTLSLAVYGGLILLYVLLFAVIQTRLTNTLYSHLFLEGVRFESTLALRHMIVLYLTNTFAILFSLGLAIPWVRVRMAHYRAANMFVTAGDLDAIAAQSSAEISAAADAMTDIFDMDIGL